MMKADGSQRQQVNEAFAQTQSFLFNRAKAWIKQIKKTRLVQTGLNCISRMNEFNYAKVFTFFVSLLFKLAALFL